MKWKTSDGSMINIRDMSDEHIINTIKWLTNDPLFGQLNKDDKPDIEWIFLFAGILIQRNRLDIGEN